MQSFKLKLVEQKYQVLAEELYCLLIQKKFGKVDKKFSRISKSILKMVLYIREADWMLS